MSTYKPRNQTIIIALIIRKQAARILKALRDRSPELRQISSFVFKTLLLTECQKDGLDWSQDALAKRVNTKSIHFLNPRPTIRNVQIKHALINESK